MNKHIFLDRFTTLIAAATLGKNRFFSESIDTLGYAEHLQQVSFSIRNLDKGIHEVEAGTLAGTMDPAFNIYQWQGYHFPTIIYHHGNNERPFDFGRYAKNSFKNIFVDHRDKIEANIIAIRAPYHHSSLKFYQKKMNRLSNFIAMLTTSVKLIEAIIQQLKDTSEAPVLVSGISLGGWVTNLHRSYYNSADAYVPLLAGAALDHLFTDTVYRKMADRKVKENPDIIRNALNFEEEFSKITSPNVFPLLGKYDQYIQYERQKHCYEAKPKVLETGHITGFLASDELRNHLLYILQKIINSKTVT